MASEKPTIILVHGAFHKPSCFKIIKDKLEKLSYPVATVLLATVKGDDPSLLPSDDVNSIHEVIIPLVDVGKNIIIVAHSYGGIPGCASIEGHTVSERKARGEKGGITAILFMAAFAIPKRGMTCTEAWNAEAKWVSYDMAGPYGYANADAKEILFNDLPAALQEEMFAEIAPNRQALGAFTTPIQFIPSDLTIPATYLLCENDKCMAPSTQEGFIAATPKMKVERCTSGHSPFLSQTDKVVEVIVKVAEGANGKK